MMRSKLSASVVGLAVVCAAAWAWPVQAATFRARGTISGYWPDNIPGLQYVDGGEYDFSSPTRVAITSVGYQVNPLNAADYFGTGGQGYSGVSAGPGYARAAAYVQLDNNNPAHPDLPPRPFQFSAVARATSTFSDVLVTGPVGATSVYAKFNLAFDGTFANAASNAITDSDTEAYNFAGIGLNINGISDSLHASSGNEIYLSGDGVAPHGVGQGILADATSSVINGVFQTGLLEVPVNQPFTINLDLNVTTRVSGPVNRYLLLAANSDFSHTLSFATDRPVLDLPAGYALNSADAGIVNNLYSLPVPEPGSLALLALGTAALLRRHRAEPLAA